MPTELGTLDSCKAFTSQTDDRLPKATQDTSTRAKNLPMTFTSQ